MRNPEFVIDEDKMKALMKLDTSRVYDMKKKKADVIMKSKAEASSAATRMQMKAMKILSELLQDAGIRVLNEERFRYFDRYGHEEGGMLCDKIKEVWANDLGEIWFKADPYIFHSNNDIVYIASTKTTKIDDIVFVREVRVPHIVKNTPTYKPLDGYQAQPRKLEPGLWPTTLLHDIIGDVLDGSTQRKATGKRK